MNPSEYSGRSYICLVRCSTDEQTGTSIPDQLNLLHAYAKEQGMVHAGDDKIVDGVTGSIPGARTDFDQVIARKNERNDFDVLLVQDLSRLTRSGVEHGSKIEYDLAGAGIHVIFVGSNLPQGDHAGIVKSVEYFAAQQYAKSVSYSTARGQMSALLDGRMQYCLRMPYGIDRLYVSMDGKPLHVIRNLSDGSQVKLDPTTKQVMETYAKGSGYRKQKGEKAVLIVGADERVEIVRQIFRRRLVDGWGSYRIAKELNDAGAPGPNGGIWHTQSVKVILENPIYTSVSYANRKSDAVYNMRSAKAPTAAKVDRQELVNRRRPKMRFRARAEWIEQKHPMLEDFLGELRPLVGDFQKIFLQGEARIAQPRRDRHTQSGFILKGLLHSAQGGLPMTGIIKGRGYRYYWVSRAYPTSDLTIRRLVRAEPLEQAVLAALREVLGQKSALSAQLEAALRRQHDVVDGDRHELNGLLDEREKVQRQLEFIIDSLGTLGREAAQRKAAQLEGQLQALQNRIAKASAPSAGAIDSATVVDEIMQRFDQMLQQLADMSPQTLRSLLGLLVSELEIDLETLTVKIELGLPSWAVLDPNRYIQAMGLKTTSCPRTGDETHSRSGVSLAVFDCETVHRNCFDCRRRAA